MKESYPGTDFRIFPPAVLGSLSTLFLSTILISPWRTGRPTEPILRTAAPIYGPFQNKIPEICIPETHSLSSADPVDVMWHPGW